MNRILLELHTGDTQTRFKELDKKLTKLVKVKKITQVISVQDFLAQLEQHETELARAFLDAKPEDFGLKTPPLGIEAPVDIIKIDNYEHLRDTVEGRTRYQYMPAQIYEHFVAMQSAFAHDRPGRILVLESAYRSPAYQIVVLVDILINLYNFDLHKTLKSVALPDCSQHCSATRTALDLANIDGLPSEHSPRDFAESIEYEWLKQHASEYSFYESYPPNNPVGIAWEPWHWQYKPSL